MLYAKTTFSVVLSENRCFKVTEFFRLFEAALQLIRGIYST